MKTICFSSLKGGSGKSSLSILSAERLTRGGSRVLCIDLDIQNSLSYQLTKGAEPIDLERNMFRAFQDGDLAAQIHPSRSPGSPDFIISDLRLLDLQDRMAPLALRDLLSAVSARYDFLIIDSAPTYNSLVTAAYCASDLVVIPVELSLFDLKSLHFLFSKLAELGLDRLASRILINKYEAPKSAKDLVHEYVDLLEEGYGAQVLKARIPYSPLIRTLLDTGKALPRGAVSRALDAFVLELRQGLAA
ncbi:MAG: ParA family protein [Spirochaetes bacterium]|nr:ParA family protein [Spirochaetota bacterium]